MSQHLSEFPSFIRLNNIPLYVHITFCSVINGHLGCFHLLAIVNNIPLNVGIQISVQVSAFNSLVYLPRSGMKMYGLL